MALKDDLDLSEVNSDIWHTRLTPVPNFIKTELLLFKNHNERHERKYLAFIFDAMAMFRLQIEHNEEWFQSFK